MGEHNANCISDCEPGSSEPHQIAWEASTLLLSYTRNFNILAKGRATDVKDSLPRWYKCQQFLHNSGIFGNEQ